jgi:glucosamine 6-phosphate synthetase-like amidotransferase/phosphosugar isomerase protein
MNGTEETKGFILKTLTDEVLDIHKNGCTVGRVHDEQMKAVNKCLDGVQKALEKIVEKLEDVPTLRTEMNDLKHYIFGGLFLMIVIQVVLKLFVRV